MSARLTRARLAADPVDVRRRPVGVRDASAVGLVVALVSYLGAWIPSYSFDETITMSLIHRTPLELAQVLPNIDAVHGFYYFVVQGWAEVFGDSRAATRLLSSIAIGIAAALTVAIARRLSTRTVAIISGLAVVIIPRGAWAGAEARSYAFTLVAFCLCILLLLIAAHNPRWGWWVAYGVVVALSCVLFAYLVFLPIANALSIILIPAYRRRWLPAAIAGVAGVIAVSPFLYLVSAQKGQVLWIPPLSAHTWSQVLVEQWFVDSRPLALVCALLLVAGAVVFLVRRRRGRPPLSGSTILAVAVPQLVLCTVGVLALSAILSPLYVPRYLASTTPALAMLIGFAVGALIPEDSAQRTRWLRWAVPIVATLALAAVAVPQFLYMRGPYSNQSDYSQAADWVGNHARSGDAVVFARPGYPVDMHVVEYASFGAFTHLDDIMQATTPIQANSYWGAMYPFSDVQTKIGDHRRVIVIANVLPVFDRTDVYGGLTALGFRAGAHWDGPYSSVNIMTR